MKIFRRKKQPPVETFLGVRKVTPPKVHKHQILVPLMTFLVLGVFSCLLFLVYGGSTYEDADVKRVQLYVDGTEKTIPTRAPTVGELLKRINISLKPQDIVEPGINSPINEDDIHINVYRAKPVTVIDENGHTVSTKIADTTPENMAAKAGFKLRPEDKAEIAAPDVASRQGVIGDLVMIERSVPLRLNLYGKKVHIRTTADTVGDLLNEKGVVLGPKDKVIPGASTPIKKGMEVLVLRNGKQIINVEEKIAPPVDTQLDATLDAGTIKVIDPGKPGKRIVTYEVTFKHDKEVSRKKIQTVIISKPQKRKVIEGTKNTGFTGGLGAAMAALRGCEAGGNYANKSNPTYRGAYQFRYDTWGNYGGYHDPADAPPYIQDQKALDTYHASGWTPWPACSKSLGLQDRY